MGQRFRTCNADHRSSADHLIRALGVERCKEADGSQSSVRWTENRRHRICNQLCCRDELLLLDQL